MIATDTEVPNTRVLVQQLPFGNLGPDDAEHTRQVLTQRLIALSHVQGLARLVDSFSAQHRYFLVFELPTGDLLSDRLRRAGGRLGEVTAVSTALQVLDILDELDHEMPPVTHGNICPAHIILRPGGRVTLVGISPTLLVFAGGQVLNGPAAGMPGYAAPEQSRGQASPRADLFSVCAVIYDAVTGAPPAARPTALYQPARRVNSDVSPELEEVLSKGLRPSQAQRFQTAADLRAALVPIAAGQRSRRRPQPFAGDERAERLLVPMRDERGRFVVPRQPMLQNPLFLVACVLALIVVVGGGVLYALQPHTGGAGPRPDARVQAEAAQLFMTKGIGLSGGAYVFDTDRGDNDTKQQAERAVAAGNRADGMRLFEQALKQDPADAEAAIYAADLRILQGGRPYVSVVAAVAFGAEAGGGSAAARSALQGVYLAQERVNTAGLMPGGIQLRALILSSGKETAGATAAARLLLDEQRAGMLGHVIGLVGWPESDQTRLALAEQTGSELAIVSPTASADGLGDTSTSFVPLVPSDTAQAGELADAAHQLNAHRIVVVADPQDPTSAAMGDGFAARLGAQYAGAVTIPRSIPFAEGAPNDFDGIARAALDANADLIYLAGGDDDAVQLALAVRQRLGPGNNRPRILVGPRANTLALLGLGDSPTAGLARSSLDALSLVYVATLASPGAWDVVQAGAQAGGSFGDAYLKQFGAAAGPDRSNGPDATVMLSYDAADLLAAAGRQLLAGNTSQSVTTALDALDPAAIRTRLRAFDANHPFVGVGGAVGFDASGALPQKALAILRILPPNPPSSPGVRTQVALVVGGKALFCGPFSCQLTL
jgi:ABC-type branched-subunit amino acid transport system substrate-binding protein